MLICAFYYCNKSCSHKFMAILATYGFNVPICSSGLIYSVHLALYFLEDKVPIPRIHLLQEVNLDAKILVKLLLHLLLYLPNLKFQCHLCVFLALASDHFLAVCQSICFLVSPEIFVLSTEAIMSLISSRTVLFLTRGIKFFNCFVDEFLQC